MSVSSKLRIWCNQRLPETAQRALIAGVAEHEFAFASGASNSNLDTASPDQLLHRSDVAFGQPHPRDIVDSPKLKWVHLSTAGYATYDRDDVRAALRERGGAMTNSSSVYSEPCAQHVLAMMLGLSRSLPEAMRDQAERRWDYLPLRARSRLLVGESVVIVGYGAIGRRLVEMLAPFQMNIIAVRRKPRGDEGVPAISIEQLDSALSRADHVVDLLPGGVTTNAFFNVARFSQMKSRPTFYNVGRGTTVEQAALVAALQSGQLSAAYIDVTNPEPPTANDPIWTAPNCYLTPHSAGGHRDEYERLVAHFLTNLRRFEAGEPLRDRIA